MEKKEYVVTAYITVRAEDENEAEETVIGALERAELLAEDGLTSWEVDREDTVELKDPEPIDYHWCKEVACSWDMCRYNNKELVDRFDVHPITVCGHPERDMLIEAKLLIIKEHIPVNSIWRTMIKCKMYTRKEG